MAEPNLTQGVVAVVALLTGVALGLVVDARRAVQAVGRPGRWVGHALDVGAVAAMVPVVAAGLLLADWGAMRFFVLAAIAAGLWLYLAWGSPLILPATVWCLRLLCGVIGWTVRALLAPPRWVLRVSGPPSKRLAAFASGQAHALVGRLPRRPAPPSSG